MAKFRYWNCFFKIRYYIFKLACGPISSKRMRVRTWRGSFFWTPFLFSRCLNLYSSLFRNFRCYVIYRVNETKRLRDAKRNALIITFRPLRSLAYPTKCFSILARTQLCVAKANELYISSYREPPPSLPPPISPLFLRSVLFAKESTLSRYFHRTACENIKFILLPSPYYTRYRRYIPLPLFGIECAFALTALRGNRSNDKSARDMLVRYISKGLLHIIFPVEENGTICIKIGINRWLASHKRDMYLTSLISFAG